MNKLIIKEHDFEEAKRGLKEFSEKKAEELEIDTVRTDGGFLGLGNHKVTGYELNSIITTIQKHLIDLNTMNNKTIKEFAQVYNALEALDKDYIQAILLSIKATEKTSESIQSTQEQIKKIIDDQKKTLEVLKRFKEKLDGYNHLKDIDEVWESLSNINISLANISNKLSSFKNSVSKQQSDIEILLSFMENLSDCKHLRDIDDIWSSNKLHSSQLSELEKQRDEIKSTIQTIEENTDATIKSVIEKNDTAVQMLTKKIKYAYLITGGTLGIAIIELIVILLKVI